MSHTHKVSINGQFEHAIREQALKECRAEDQNPGVSGIFRKGARAYLSQQGWPVDFLDGKKPANGWEFDEKGLPHVRKGDFYGGSDE